MAYVGWWSTCQLAVFSSAEVSCVGLEPRSSGVCRSNDTITATGILTPRVEIRHICLHLSQGGRGWERGKNKLVQLFQFYIAFSPNSLKRDAISHSQTPPMHHQPSSFTQHQIDARERNRERGGGEKAATNSRANTEPSLLSFYYFIVITFSE